MLKSKTTQFNSCIKAINSFQIEAINLATSDRFSHNRSALSPYSEGKNNENRRCIMTMMRHTIVFR